MWSKKKKQAKDQDQEYENEEKYADFEYKLILVGSAEVGKTSIINRYLNDEFDPNQGNSTAVGIQSHQYEFPETNEIA